MTISLTIDLSPSVYAYLQDVATLTNQSIERIVQMSISGNLPPRISDALPEMQESLLAMQSLSIEELQAIAFSEVSEKEQQRHVDLLSKNADGTITTDERSELSSLRIAADQLMVRKAHAWALLRWHGQPVPTLNELPLN